jgi:hypothetical protein
MVATRIHVVTGRAPDGVFVPLDSAGEVPLDAAGLDRSRALPDQVEHSRRGEVAGASGRGEGVKGSADRLPQGVDGALGGGAQPPFQLGEGELDRV